MIGWTALIIALALFASASLKGYRSAVDPHRFFHVDGLRRNVLSLGIADITLGTGFAYVLSASSQFGLFMLAMPIGLLTGYQVLATVYRRIGLRSAIAPADNLILAIRDSAVESGAIKTRWTFDALVTIPLISIYVLFVCYEVFASSQIIAAFIAPKNGAAAAIIGGAIVAVSGMNSVAGGMQANHRNDKLLAIGIGLLLLVLIVASLAGTDVPSVPTAKAPTWTLVMVTVMAFLTAAATQLYSLLNAYNGANFARGSDAAVSFQRVGWVIAGFIAILVVLGSIWPLNLTSGFPAALAQRLDSLGLPSLARTGLTAVIVFGMTAVVFSTIDTLVTALAYFIRRHLLNLGTASKSAVGQKGPSRLIVAALYFGAIPPLAFLYLTNPNLFTLLLTLGGGGAIYAPLVLAGAWALGTSGKPYRLTAGWLAAFAALFVTTGFISIWMITGNPSAMPLASLTSILLASALAGLWFLKSKVGLASSD